MNVKSSLILLLVIFNVYPVAHIAYAQEITFSSSENRTSLIELYTSEGCSSCPPADNWLSQLKHSDKLWNTIIPVAFHVDYWDYLGWQDKFSEKQHAQRQYTYQKLKYLSTVYTPGVMKNGREWRGWRWWQSPEPESNTKPGKLSARLTDKYLSVFFENKVLNKSPFLLNIALLGTNIESRIRSGENEGKILKHDFVVLKFQQYPVIESKKSVSWNIRNPIRLLNPKANAIAIWISTREDPTPLQTTGSWLN